MYRTASSMRSSRAACQHDCFMSARVYNCRLAQARHSLSVDSHLQPRLSGGTYTMPQRETVAGEATDRSPTSNSMRMVSGFSFSLSPFGRQRVQLSSKTCKQHICYIWQQQLREGDRHTIATIACFALCADVGLCTVL